jgi:LPS O-antigen subunit length determinant protein (WzzB/FepE family)
MKVVVAIVLVWITHANAFGVTETNRRSVLSSLFKVSTASATLAFLPSVSNADELSEEEKARIARKMELLEASKSGKREVVSSAAAIRSDINPDAAVSLRSRSALENTKIAMEKQKELKNRNKAQKREDLCEMLGRGC